MGQRVKLRPWQKREIKKIFDNPAITRRAILSFGRKNGKTALAAFLLLCALCGPLARRNSQLYSAAQSRGQAAVLFELAAKIVRMSPALKAYVKIGDTSKKLSCPSLGSVYQALSAESKTAHGLSPVFIVHDELGQVRGPTYPLYEALETAAAAQQSPLSIIISTQAATDADLLSILIDDAAGGHDPKTTLSLYTADKELDPFSVKAIRQANPAYNDFQMASEVKSQAAAAKRMPSAQPAYLNLILNQRVEAHSPFISRTLWQGAEGAVPLDMGDNPVYLGLDLSSTQDLTALSLIAEIDGKFYHRPYFWLPEVGLVDKSRADRVPYDLWQQQGYLLTTPGQAVEYDFVADFLRGIFDSHNVRAAAFDRWNFKHFRGSLHRAGFSEDEIENCFVEFGQGFRSMSPALRETESILLASRLVQDGNPVMNMCAGNAVVQTDPAGNRKLTKAKSSGRIDGMVSMVMALAAAQSDQPEALAISPWEDPDFRIGQF